MNFSELRTDEGNESDSSDTSIDNARCSVFMNYKKVEDGGVRCAKLLSLARKKYDEKKYKLAVILLSGAIKSRYEDNEDMMSVYHLMANAYCYLGKYKKALHCHKHEVFIARILQDKRAEARAFANFAITCVVMENFNHAIKCSLMEIELYQKVDDKDQEAEAFYCLGGIYRHQARHLIAVGLRTGDLLTHQDRITNSIVQAVLCYNMNIRMINIFRKQINKLKQKSTVAGKSTGATDAISSSSKINVAAMNNVVQNTSNNDAISETSKSEDIPSVSKNAGISTSTDTDAVPDALATYANLKTTNVKIIDPDAINTHVSDVTSSSDVAQNKTFRKSAEKSTNTDAVANISIAAADSTSDIGPKFDVDTDPKSDDGKKSSAGPKGRKRQSKKKLRKQRARRNH